jgi:hypothetical protein
MQADERARLRSLKDLDSAAITLAEACHCIKTITFFAKDFRKTADIASQGCSPKTSDMFNGKQVSAFSNLIRERTCGRVDSCLV